MTKLLMTKLVCLLVVAGCAPFNGSLKEGEALPDGKVLLVGAIALDPPVEQGRLVSIDVRGASRGVIRFALTNDLSKKVDPGTTIPISPDEVLLMKLKGLSCIPLQPGTRYIRMGMLDKSSRYYILAPPGPNGISTGFKGVDVTSLHLVRDLKIDIPDNVKVVYIGTIIFRHDGKRATGVQVRDDFKQAAKELAAMNISGVSSGDVVKKLAQVVN